MNLRVNEVDLYYEIIGTGKPFIMVHGNGEDHHTFDELADILKIRYQVYLIDSRMHGKSQKNVDISFDLMAHDIINFCEKLDLKDVRFLGFSDGGIIGLKIAIEKPKLISDMILCGANYHPKGVDRNVIKHLRDAYKINKSPLIKLMLSEPKFKIKDLKKISTKTMILAGEHDVIIKKHTMKLHQFIKNSTCHILPEENHESYVMHSIKLLTYID